MGGRIAEIDVSRVCVGAAGKNCCSGNLIASHADREEKRMKDFYSIAGITFGGGAYDAFLNTVGRMQGYNVEVKVGDREPFYAEIIEHNVFQPLTDTGEPTGERVVIDTTNGPFLEAIHVY